MSLLSSPREAATRRLTPDSRLQHRGGADARTSALFGPDSGPLTPPINELVKERRVAAASPATLRRPAPAAWPGGALLPGASHKEALGQRERSHPDDRGHLAGGRVRKLHNSVVSTTAVSSRIRPDPTINQTVALGWPSRSASRDSTPRMSTRWHLAVQPPVSMRGRAVLRSPAPKCSRLGRRRPMQRSSCCPPDRSLS